MTTRATIAESRAFVSWQDYQEALKRAIAPLTDEQLGQRLLAGRRTPGEIAEHIVFGRAFHLTRTLGADAVAELAPYQRWDDEGDPPRTAAEILQGLAVTWRIIEDRLIRGSSGDALPDGEVEVVQTIWGLLDHDCLTPSAVTANPANRGHCKTGQRRDSRTKTFIPPERP